MLEAAELEPRRALADAEIEPAVTRYVEGGETFGGARWVIVVRDHLADAVTEPDIFGASRGCSQKHFRSR